MINLDWLWLTNHVIYIYDDYMSTINKEVMYKYNYIFWKKTRKNRMKWK